MDNPIRSYIKNISSKRRTCEPHKNILYLKTHKTGGSTVTNILNRFGESRDLNFVLPKIGHNRLDWPFKFTENSYYPLNGTVPNILCNHARFNHDVMSDIMPSDSFYVTILRHPVAQFESAFSYLKLADILGKSRSAGSPRAGGGRRSPAERQPGAAPCPPPPRPASA